MQDSRNDPEPIKARRDVPEVHCIKLHGLGSDAIAYSSDGKSGYRKYHHTAAAGYGAVWVCKILKSRKGQKMFIWTISDVIGVLLGAFAAIFFGGIFVAIKIQDWKLARRRAKGKAANQ